MRLQGSGLFKSAKENKHRPNAIFSIIIFFCLWGGSLILGRFVTIPIIELFPNDMPLWIAFTSALRKILICGFQILVFFAWVKLVESAE